jgi:Flp pilus assembly protein TadG
MKEFWADIRGQVAIIFTLVIPVLVGSVGMAVDYTAWTAQVRKLQGTADAAAIAAVRELYLANTTDGQVEAVAALVARAQFDNSGRSSTGLTVATDIRHDRGAVQVTVSQAREIYFSQVFGTSFADLAATAVARAAGGGRICVIGLDDYASGTVRLERESRLTAPRCAVYSNSLSSSGIDVSGLSMLDAELVCSAGGLDGTSANFGSTAPLTDCPQIQDPLAERPQPHVGSCDHEGLYLAFNKSIGPLIGSIRDNVGQLVLYPGTYCGGLVVSHSNLLLMPGVYVISGGPLHFRAGTTVFGENVGFFLHGDAAALVIESDSTVDLTAPLDGPLAGLLVFEDRHAPLDREHVIKSNDASVLLGTIYLSRGAFVVDTNARVADESAYTAIVARRLVLRRRPNLFLNADYDATDVPVPEGVGPVGGNIFLER